MFTHQSPAMPSRYSRPSASTTVESLAETMTSCCCSSCLWGTAGWITLSRSRLTTDDRSGDDRSGTVGMIVSSPGLPGRALADRLAGRERPAGRVERGLPLAAEALARELDQMMADHRALQQLFQLTPTEGGQGQAPEGAPVVAPDPDLPDDASEQCQARSDVGPRRPARAARVGRAPREGVREVVGEPAIDRLRGVRGRDAAAPHREHALLGEAEYHVGLAAAVGQKPALRVQPVPERGLGQGVEDVDREHRNLGGLDELHDV